MKTLAPGHRLTAATAIDRGDRLYQQDQVEVYAHPRVAGCLLAILADGMGGKSGGRKAADQVLLIARQLFERFVPVKDSAEALLKRLVDESHLMIKLTAITSEQEPHSTIAAALLLPNRECHVIHAGDSRVYLFRGPQMLTRTLDHSLVQRLIDQGEISEDEANDHPHGHLLTGCLGADEDPPITLEKVQTLELGDTVLLCSDGLWHYFTPRELGTITHALKPRDATKMLIAKARQRARGGGDNVSLALVKVEALNAPDDGA
jgi:serine/threonine protein phosphatase PrpC